MSLKRLNNKSNVLIYAGGGGGDVATAGYLYSKFNKVFRRIYISALPWERFVVDPLPGPIRMEELRNVEKLGDLSLIAYKKSYALRGGRKIVFQASRLANALDIPIYLVTGENGVEGIYRGLKEIIEYIDADVIIGLDVGGDVLAVGYEDDLWSPLADQMMIAALYKLEEDGYSTFIGVSSPGADGELSQDYVLERIESIAVRGGFRGAVGFGMQDLECIEVILKHVYTEAGSIVKYALEGRLGELPIRDSTRKVRVSIFSPIIFFLTTSIVYKDSLMANKIINTKSIEEANRIIRLMGIPTEYSLEEILYSKISRGESIDKSTVLRVWQSLKGPEM